MIEACPILCGQLRDLLQAGPADAPGGGVDDPPQPQVVRRVADHGEVGQHVPHLGPVKELHSPVDLVRNSVALKSHFQCVGLGIHAVEDCVVPPGASAAIALQNAAGNKVGLVALVQNGLDQHLFSGAALGPQGFALAARIVPDDGVGSVQNILRGAVILLQTDGAAGAVLLLKGENIFDIGPAKAVDGLVVIPHHADILPAAGQQPGQEILEMVGILVLVNEDVAKLFLVIGPDLLILLQQMDRVEDDVVKIHRIGLPQAAIIAGVDLGDAGHAPVAGGLGLLGELVRGLIFVLCVADDRENGPGLKFLLVQAEGLQHVLDDPFAVVRVVDGKAAGEADIQTLHIPAQNADARAVKGSGPDIPGCGPAHPLQAFLQLSGGLVGKRDGDNRPGRGRFHGAQPPGTHPVVGGWVLRKFLQKQQVLLGSLFRNKIRIAAPAEGQKVIHPVDQYCGLAAAGSGQQQQRPFRGQHRLLLPGVHPAVAAGNNRPAGSCIAVLKRLCHIVPTLSL